MKKLVILVFVLVVTISLFSQSVGINSDGSAPTSGAMLEVIQSGTTETTYFKNSNADGYGTYPHGG